jgi:AcrR family transcriptional regulator
MGVLGRPRDVNRDVAILDAALLLLTEVGYDQLSMESIAGRAGVAKTTIYRRYSDKAALVAAAVEYRSSSTPPEPGPGGLRDNLLTLVRWLGRQIAEQEIGCSVGCSPACVAIPGSRRRCAGFCAGTRRR